MQQLVICILGLYTSDSIKQLNELILKCGGQIDECRMTTLGEQFAMNLLLSGSWDAIAKLESQLGFLCDKLGVQLIKQRTQAVAPPDQVVPYMVEVMSTYRADLILTLTQFFARYDIPIIECSMERYSPPRNSTQLCALSMSIGVPAQLMLVNLRNEFMDLCDELNLDAVMGPLK